MKNSTSLIDAINYRRSVRVYDKTKEIDPEIVKKCVQQATLAPNSSNMQLWEFHHITSKEILDQLTAACLDQSAAKTAKEIVVIVVRIVITIRIGIAVRVVRIIRTLVSCVCVLRIIVCVGPVRLVIISVTVVAVSVIIVAIGIIAIIISVIVPIIIP